MSSIGVGKKNLLEETLELGNVGVPSSFVASQRLEEGWMVKLICGVHNHELAKSLVGHPYAG